MKFNLKKFKKPSIYFVGVIIGIYVFVGFYSLIFEQDKLAIDRYNFQQLEKAKQILESIPTNAPKFYGLKQFNDLYKADIKPIENCYYVRTPNGNEKYIFGFQLKSKIYQLVYFGKPYAYPNYDLPLFNGCIMGDGCYDRNYAGFLNTISNPCKE